MIRQLGALPYRIDETGELRVLLVTSRDTGRWVVPKGNPMRFRKAHQAAAQEAFEEAGVEGEIAETAIGSFRYHKRRRLLADTDAEVRVFPLRVEKLLDEWPEAHQRRRQWFSREEAAQAVAEPDLQQLIRDFRP